MWQRTNKKNLRKLSTTKNLVASELWTVDSSSLQVHLADDQETFPTAEKAFQDPSNQVKTTALFKVYNNNHLSLCRITMNESVTNHSKRDYL